jgi:hypothetical protein
MEYVQQLLVKLPLQLNVQHLLTQQDIILQPQMPMQIVRPVIPPTKYYWFLTQEVLLNIIVLISLMQIQRLFVLPADSSLCWAIVAQVQLIVFRALHPLMELQRPVPLLPILISPQLEASMQPMPLP